MTDTQKAAMEQALEALEWADNAMYEGTPIQVNTQKAITALRDALAEQPAEQEPVAWMNDEGDVELSHKPWMSSVWLPLYTAPQPAKREPLTDEQCDEILDAEDWYNFPRDVIRATERAHGIKENT